MRKDLRIAIESKTDPSNYQRTLGETQATISLSQALCIAQTSAETKNAENYIGWLTITQQ
jgi:hypothetical protein